MSANKTKSDMNSHHLADHGVLHHLTNLRSHTSKLRVRRDDLQRQQCPLESASANLIENLGTGHHIAHLLHECRRLHHLGHLSRQHTGWRNESRTALGSPRLLTPIPVNGLKPPRPWLSDYIGQSMTHMVDVLNVVGRVTRNIEASSHGRKRSSRRCSSSSSRLVRTLDHMEGVSSLKQDQYRAAP